MSLKRVFAFVLTIATMVSVAVVPTRASLDTMGSFIALLGVPDDVLSSQRGSATGDAKYELADAEYEVTVLKTNYLSIKQLNSLATSSGKCKSKSHPMERRFSTALGIPDNT